MISVLLADDHSIVREGLRKVLEDSMEIEVIAEAADGEAAVDEAIKKKPDVAVVDISMPGMDGLEVVARLSSYCQTKLQKVHMHSGEHPLIASPHTVVANPL